MCIRDRYKCLLAAIAFAVWALMGWLAMKDAGRRWSLAALCPLGLALLVGFAIPDRVIDSKQPQFLVDIVSESLQPSRYVLTNKDVYKRQGYDVVGTVRQNRQDSIFRKTASKMINRLIQRTTGKAMGDYGCMLREIGRAHV